MTCERVLFAASHSVELLGYVFPIQCIKTVLADRLCLRDEPRVEVLFYRDARGSRLRALAVARGRRTASLFSIRRSRGVRVLSRLRTHVGHATTSSLLTGGAVLADHRGRRECIELRQVVGDLEPWRLGADEHVE